MSYHFPHDLVAAPTGQRVAWLAVVEGRRNVWVADGPACEPRRLTAYLGDDGQELSGLAFTPDGERLVFLRGCGPNMDGETPNPVSEIEAPSRDLWTVPARGGEPARLAGAVSPVMSPTGARLAWASRGQAWLLDLDDVHGFLLHRNWMATFEASADFLDRWLKAAGAEVRTDR